MKKLVLYFLFFTVAVNAQELAIDAGASITLGVGTSLNVVGLELQTAVSDYELTGPYSITSSNSAETIDGKEGIIFSFENTLMTGYKGTIVLHYEDSYLNGLTEADLYLNTQDNTDSWIEHDGTIVDESENTLTMVFDNSSPISFKGVTAAEFDDTVSTDDLEFLKTHVHPNPTEAIINIPQTENFTKIVYNLLGEKLLETNEEVIDISNVPVGVYVLKIFDNKTQSTKTFKIVKK